MPKTTSGASFTSANALLVRAPETTPRMLIAARVPMKSMLTTIPPARVPAHGTNSARYVENRLDWTAAVIARTK